MAFKPEQKYEWVVALRGQYLRGFDFGQPIWTPNINQALHYSQRSATNQSEEWPDAKAEYDPREHS